MMAKIIEINSKQQFDELIKNGDKKVLVDFKAEWCGPCKMLHPLIEELSNKRDDVVFVQIDVDHNKDLAQEYNIMSIPSIKVFEKGKIIKEGLGFMSINKLEEILV